MKFRPGAAALIAVLGLGLSCAQATPVSYEYTLSGLGPTGTLDFTLANDPVFGNNASQVTAFDIHYDGLDFTELNGTLSQLDFTHGGDLFNIVYHDNLPNLSFTTLGLGYSYLNRISRRDIHAGAGLFVDGGLLDPPARVPEPASVMLLLSGLLGAAFLLRAKAPAKAKAAA